MIKRVTLCSIAFILTYCIIYAVSYNGKREEIEQKIKAVAGKCVLSELNAKLA